MADWRTALLKALGDPATPANLGFLDAWQRHEGGHTNNSARFNWLNTTHGEGPSINSVGVKAFPSFQKGIMYTAQTLMNGRYQDILDGLRSGDPSGASAGLQTWVSGRPDGNPTYAASILGGSPVPMPVRATAAVSRAREQIQLLGAEHKVSPNPQWDAAMKLIFSDDPEMAAIMAGMDDRLAQRTRLVSPYGSIRPVDMNTPEFAGAPGLSSKVVKLAGTQLGKPYVFGSGPDTSSFDCSDLIQWAYKQVGVKLPRTTYEQIHQGVSVKGKTLRPGDIIFPTTHHEVMYVGNGKVVAAPHTGTVVQYQPLSRFKSIVDVRRVIKA
jgi:cell wall-associated NlpC family hydrolase